MGEIRFFFYPTASLGSIQAFLAMILGSGDVAGSLYKQLTKAVDPDPNGSASIFFPGSESGSKREKLKNNNIKSNDIAVNNYNFNKTNKVNLDQLHGFFLPLSNLLSLFFNYSKLFIR